MVVTSVNKDENGCFFFKAYGSEIIYDPKHKSVVFYMGEDSKRDITLFFPKKLNFEEFERYSMRYLARVI